MVIYKTYVCWMSFCNQKSMLQMQNWYLWPDCLHDPLEFGMFASVCWQDINASDSKLDPCVGHTADMIQQSLLFFVCEPEINASEAHWLDVVDATSQMIYHNLFLNIISWISKQGRWVHECNGDLQRVALFSFGVVLLVKNQWLRRNLELMLVAKLPTWSYIILFLCGLRTENQCTRGKTKLILVARLPT